MSFDAIDPPDTAGEAQASAPKSKIKKRSGACNPCKLSKTKCDGGQPCGACKREKRKPKVCEYSPKAVSLAAVRRENEERNRREEDDAEIERSPKRAPRQTVRNVKSKPAPSQGMYSTSMHCAISLSGLVDEFAHVKQLNKKGAQIYEALHECWDSLHKEVMRLSLDEASLHIRIDDQYMHEHEAEAMMTQWLRGRAKVWAFVREGHLRAACEAISVLLRKIEHWESYVTHKHSSAQPPEDELLANISRLCLEIMELDCMISFSLGFLPQHTPYMQRKIEFHALHEENTKSEMYIYSQLRSMLEIDVSSEAGVWKFLHFSHIDTDQEADLLQKTAMCTTNRDSPEMQALKLLSNLMYMAMYCRKASASFYYSAQGREVPPAEGGSSDIIHTMQLQRPVVKTDNLKLVKKHAGIALYAFDRLCEVDLDATASSWFRLHGALVAGVVVATFYMGSRVGKDKKTDLEEAWELIDMLKHRFQQLGAHNPRNPIFEKGESILNLCKINRLEKEEEHTVEQQPTIFKHEIESSSEESSPEPDTTAFARQGDVFRQTSSRKRGIDDVADVDTTGALSRKKQRAVGPSGVARSQTLESPLWNAETTDYANGSSNMQHATHQYDLHNESYHYTTLPSSAESSFTSPNVQQPQQVLPANNFEHYPHVIPWQPFHSDWTFYTSLNRRYDPNNLDNTAWDAYSNTMHPTFNVNVEDRNSIYWQFTNTLSPKLRPSAPRQETSLHSPNGGLRAIEGQFAYCPLAVEDAHPHNESHQEGTVEDLSNTTDLVYPVNVQSQHEAVSADTTPRPHLQPAPNLMRRQSAPASHHVLYHDIMAHGFALPMSAYPDTGEQHERYTRPAEYFAQENVQSYTPTHHLGGTAQHYYENFHVS